MEIVLHNAENQPIYEQIARQIKEQIIAGKLQPDDPLPSIRALAKDLRISVITTKRAYDELEQQGYLFTVAGKGSFVAPRSTEIIREEHLKKIEHSLQECISLSAACGLSQEDLLELLRLLMKNEDARENPFPPGRLSCQKG